MSDLDNASPTSAGKAGGVILDPHYTDSLLRLVTPRAYGAGAGNLSTAPPFAPREFLLTLVLYGTAHLSYPTWLDSGVADELSPLIGDGLIQLVPDHCYEAGVDRLRTVVGYLQDAVVQHHMPVYLPLGIDGKIDRFAAEEIEYEHAIETGEATQNVILMERLLASVEPLIAAAHGHLLPTHGGMLASDPDAVLGSYARAWHSDIMEPHELLFDSGITGWRDGYDIASGSFLRAVTNSPEAHRDEDFEEIAEQGRLYDATLAAFAIDRFASMSGMPVQSAVPHDSVPLFQPAYIPEAHQLLRVQFERLRYPVIETLDDVRRLRDDRHFEAYHTLISEFSERLGTELEAGKAHVLEEFRTRLQGAMDAMKTAERIERRAQLPFFLRVALAGVGIVAPSLDFIVTEVWQKIISTRGARKRKDKEWILFGRPTWD